MYATGPRKISSTRMGPFGTVPSCPPASAATDDMSTEIAPRRPRGSITPEPLRGKRDPSAPTEPLSDIRKPVDPDVAVTASETSLAETVEPPDPHAARARAARLGRDLGVGQVAPVRDLGRSREDLALEPVDQDAVGPQLEPAPVPLEVLVELPASVVEPLGGAQDPRRDARGELVGD